MIICIVATICKETGALSIYNQMLRHLKVERCETDLFYVFVDPIMPKPVLNNVKYISYNTSGKRRIKFDFHDFRRLCRLENIKPDVIFSLNNTGVWCPKTRQIIYYHQGLPLYNHYFSFKKKKDRVIWAFTQIYPVYVKMFLKRQVEVVVQTEIVKKLFASRYNFPEDRVHVAFPDVEQINPELVEDYKYTSTTCNFVYPATNVSYKEHITIIRALKEIKDKEILHSIKIHFTIHEDDCEDLQKEITNQYKKNFVFHGSVSHDKLLSLYKSSNGLLFPSVIETIGLPLLEAAAFGLPVVANDLDYVKSVLGDYSGLLLVSLRDYKSWSETIVNVCKERPRFSQYQHSNGSDWPRIFELIHNK